MEGIEFISLDNTGYLDNITMKCFFTTESQLEEFTFSFIICLLKIPKEYIFRGRFCFLRVILWIEILIYHGV